MNASNAVGGIDIDAGSGGTNIASATATGDALTVVKTGGGNARALVVTGNGVNTSAGFVNTPLVVTNGATNTDDGFTYSASFSDDVSAANFRSTSDGTVKTNIEEIDCEDSLKKVSGLRPVKFHFKKDIQRNPNAPKDIGFIAQEAKRCIPDLVGGELDGEGLMNFNYSKLVVDLTGSVQALLKRIETLENELVAQKKAMLAMQKLAHTGLKSVQQ